MDKPDVVGFTLGEAVRLLHKVGIEVRDIVLTAPPRLAQMTINNKFRVVRQEISDDGGVKLLVCNPKMSDDNSS